MHPGVLSVPDPIGSAFMHWGSDPHETGWTFWRAGYRSDDLIATAVQPDVSMPVYIAGEAFSRAQAWVEGALETAELVMQRLVRGLSRSPRS
jgi:monoamine oxidase